MNKDVKLIVLHGLPGSGKGTLLASITTRRAVATISAGDLVRAELKRNTTKATAFVSYLNRGELIPDALISNTVLEELDRVAGAPLPSPILIDGFPRTKGQAKTLIERCIENERVLFCVVHLYIPSNRAKLRMANRRICPLCGAIYNTESRPPIRRGICDIDYTPLQTRGDDTPSLLHQRFSQYEQAYHELSEFYRQRALRVLSLDSLSSADSLAESTIALMDSAMAPQ